MGKLYIVVRADLAPGAQLAQACHAYGAFEAEHREVYRAWHGSSQNLAVLQVPDESALMQLQDRVLAAGVPLSLFREPDFDNAVTAIAIADEGWRLVSSLPLALRSPKASQTVSRQRASPTS